jgi:hypothetical protein
VHRRAFLQTLTGPLVASRVGRPQSVATWTAGVASVDITPDRSLWMAGFARRSRASQGVALPLHAKALALRAGGGQPAVLVTVDLLGVTARMTDAVAGSVSRLHHIPRANLLFNASHTHCGPVVDEQLSVAYGLSSQQWDAIRAYTTGLERVLVSLVGTAVSRLAPAAVRWGRGAAQFAANRRVAFTPDGPVDHAVPVLRIDRPGGAPLAIVFGYACHNTTLQDSFVQFHGDYAGVAQAELERRHAGATTLFVAGCGADANPRPRGTLEHVNAHGTALADAVDRTLAALDPVAPALETAFGSVDLPFLAGAARDEWRRRLTIEPIYLQRHEALLQAAVAQHGRLPAAQAAPVQVWRLGTGLTLAALSGEVVVDYALRLAREYPDRRMWVAGYSNDVFGYLPSARVLKEGGYEGGDAMIYYGRPAPFAEGVEDLVIGEVRRLMRGQA